MGRRRESREVSIVVFVYFYLSFWGDGVDSERELKELSSSSLVLRKDVSVASRTVHFLIITFSKS